MDFAFDLAFGCFAAFASDDSLPTSSSVVVAEHAIEPLTATNTSPALIQGARSPRPLWRRADFC